MPRPRRDRDVRKNTSRPSPDRDVWDRDYNPPYDLLSHSQFVPHCTLTVSVLMLSKMWHIPHREVNIATWHDCRMSTSTVVYMCACVCVEFVFQCRIWWLEEGDMWTATSACPAGRLAWRGFTGVLVYFHFHFVCLLSWIVIGSVLQVSATNDITSDCECDWLKAPSFCVFFSQWTLVYLLQKDYCSHH